MATYTACLTKGVSNEPSKEDSYIVALKTIARPKAIKAPKAMIKGLSTYPFELDFFLALAFLKSPIALIPQFVKFNMFQGLKQGMF